jgi:hypothetical protein
MRRESDNLNNSSNNTSHSHSNFSGSDNNLTHLNYPHPAAHYSAAATAGYSGFQSSTIKIQINSYFVWDDKLCVWIIKTKISGNRANPATLISSSSQNQLEEYVDILQVQQLLLENSTTSSTSSTTVNTTSYSSPVSSITTTASTSSSSKSLQNRPRVNLQKAVEYSQVQGT